MKSEPNSWRVRRTEWPLQAGRIEGNQEGARRIEGEWCRSLPHPPSISDFQLEMLNRP